MKKSKLKFLILSLPAAAVLFPYSLNAGLRVSNSSLVQSQVQSAAAARSAAAVPSYEPQPARVVTNDNGESVTISNEDMNRCNNVYPDGAFDWVKPTTGSQRGGPATCVAYVEMRSYKNTDYNVLASAYLAAGDRTVCNIDKFDNVTKFGEDFTYPADAAPTIEDVEKVMAAEQKSNAGIKILAAAVVGGLGGNLVGKADAGSDSPLGTNKEKLTTTAIGALGGAALMTASTQSNNYKVGSTIMSTGINAAAGAVAGNLMASGDDILKIDKCTLKNVSVNATQTSQESSENSDNPDKDTKTSINVSAGLETTCLYGSYDLGKPAETEESTGESAFFYDVLNQKSYECKPKKEDSTYESCTPVSLTQINFQDYDSSITGEGKVCEPAQSISSKCADELQKKYDSLYSYHKYSYDNNKVKQESRPDSKSKWTKITGNKTGRHVAAMIVFTEKQGAFGIKHSEWLAKYSGKFNNNNLIIYDPQGSRLKDASGKEIEQFNIDNFYPTAQSADDGDMVDFSNRARAKSTMIGAGGGAALGAMSGVSGANTEIQNRWAAATQEYKDSLKNIMCVTGQRWLGVYNDVIEIAPMSTPAE